MRSSLTPRSSNFFVALSFIATLLAFVVVVKGAYVRLSNAGLGCPDWPGCYGRLSVPEHHEVKESHPGNSLDAPKAWKEMIHRYLAASLGVLILVLALLSLKEKNSEIAERKISWFLVLLVIFQALLGRWTVTLKLHPFVVMAHLIGGFATFNLLGWVSLKRAGFLKTPALSEQTSLRPRAVYAGLSILILQILLGGWMSANYASLACPDFPTCQGHWWPPMDFGEAFTLWRSLGVNYEGGVLDNPSRIAIHWMHRLWALAVFLGLGTLGLKALRQGKGSPLGTVGGVLLTLLLFQIGLGVSNVVFALPLWVATAHNGVAALLILTLLAMRQALTSNLSKLE